MLKCLEVFILIMSRNRVTGTCQHPWKVGIHDKEGGAMTDMVSKKLLFVLSLYAAGTHIWGTVDIRDR